MLGKGSCIRCLCVDVGAKEEEGRPGQDDFEAV